MQRHIVYIVNPISGTRARGSLSELISQKTLHAGIPFKIFPSVATGDYGFLREEFKNLGTTDVVIAGGDGTINGVVGSLHTTGLNFGILPLGSGNGLAWSAHVPASIEKALDVVFAGKQVLTDAFTVNGRFACMLCGVGFDAQVAHDFANDPNRGLITYVKKTVSNFFTASTYPFTLHASNEVIETEAFFISVANSNQFGNHFTIAPKASITDGLLDIVVMGKQNKLNLLYQTFRQVGGFNSLVEADIQNSNAGVLYFQTAEINILNPAGAPLHIDGDPVDTAEEIHVKIIPGCFRLLVP